MKNSKVLSNYDEKTLKKLKDSKLLLIDLDGTLIDFEKIDNIIIQTLFQNNLVINTIDNILWKINKLDILGNGYTALKIRLAFYSLFSKHSYKHCKKVYGQMYANYANRELAYIYNKNLSRLIEDGYDIAIVTKNVYAENILEKRTIMLKDELYKKIKLIVLRKGKKKKQFKEFIAKYKDRICVIGNNLSDDIISSYKIKSPYIYIGKSKIIKLIINFSNHFTKQKGIQLRDIQDIRKLLFK